MGSLLCHSLMNTFFSPLPSLLPLSSPSCYPFSWLQLPLSTLFLPPTTLFLPFSTLFLAPTTLFYLFLLFSGSNYSISDLFQLQQVQVPQEQVLQVQPHQVCPQGQGVAFGHTPYPEVKSPGNKLSREQDLRGGPFCPKTLVNPSQMHCCGLSYASASLAFGLFGLWPHTLPQGQVPREQDLSGGPFCPKTLVNPSQIHCCGLTYASASLAFSLFGLRPQGHTPYPKAQSPPSRSCPGEVLSGEVLFAPKHL